MKKRVVLLGMPNTGKSTLFNRLTGSMARTGNWPGITVDLLTARLIVGGDLIELVDLPGIYDLRGYSDDEKVVQHFLQTQAIDAILIVANAVQLQRQLGLILQVAALGRPCLLALNMRDEADQLAIRIDCEGLAQELEMPVIALSAKRGEGMRQVDPSLAALLAGDVREAQPLGQTWIHVPNEAHLSRAQERALRHIHVPAQATPQMTDRIDRWLLHPVFGLPLFFLILYVIFQGVYALGSPIQDALSALFDGIKTHLLTPWLGFLPDFLRGLLLDGLWDGLSTVASFVPVIVLFFLLMALLEDTGYFSRAAYLMDALMSRLGLDGRAFVMVLMGFGCNVPALMGTRVMRSRPLRLLTMLIIPLSLCSARLQVFLFLTSVLFSPHQAPLVLFSLYLISILTAMLTAFIFKRWLPATEPFVLELPPYRWPTLGMMWLRGWHEVLHFVRRASKFITAGVVMIWLLTHLPWGEPVASAHTLAGLIGHYAHPVLAPLGMDDHLAVTLIFGFVAKEIVLGALAVIYAAQGPALAEHLRLQMDAVQAFSYMLFTLIYTPCLSTVVTLYNESRSRLYTLVAVAWPIALAWVCSFAFYQGAHLLGYF